MTVRLAFETVCGTAERTRARALVEATLTEGVAETVGLPIVARRRADGDVTCAPKNAVAPKELARERAVVLEDRLLSTVIDGARMLGRTKAECETAEVPLISEVDGAADRGLAVARPAVMVTSTRVDGALVAPRTRPAGGVNALVVDKTAAGIPVAWATAAGAVVEAEEPPVATPVGTPVLSLVRAEPVVAETLAFGGVVARDREIAEGEMAEIVLAVVADTVPVRILLRATTELNAKLAVGDPSRPRA